MNRRTFFTSLASLGASPALGVSAPVIALFHTVSNIESPWASAPASQIIEDIRKLAARCNAREEPRPFSGNAVEVYERWHIPAPAERPIRGLAAWLPEPGTPYWPPSALAHRRP